MPNTTELLSGNQAFDCPHCNAYARQEFEVVLTVLAVNRNRPARIPLRFENEEVLLSICTHCERPAIWVLGTMVFPSKAEYPVAHEDMPDDVKEVYDEAGAIAALSPRSACALLRLALQMLLKRLGNSGDINRAIDNLEENGLNADTKRAMHILRVIGNHAVHAGEINFDSDTDTDELFNLLNAIVLELITLPRKRQELFDSLPERDKKFIEKKEGKTNKTGRL